MNQTTDTRSRKKVSWRAAMVTAPSVPPVYGIAVEVAEHNLIILADKEVKVGTSCHVYLDIPGTQVNKKNYVDFTGNISCTSLMGQVSMFRHIVQIKEINTIQRENLLKALKST
ncbi:hypothetical protein WAE56_04210 [Iodobacter sp. LRB]|uniref:PilZ domain-containing protein n=1 Tax=Iodobacter violaceini TaxID=3044271 RepID=A0ABX0KYB7_9NEIS|nr:MULTISPECIES: hypothetical protein [Iodobacter]NHQ87628.1 hypothetical protein [Iodobacter violacea]PHV02861.1 hypothetical protein CSQ88_04435 [Iodobacter sp. BJB302]